jgi:hypothetical protein
MNGEARATGTAGLYSEDVEGLRNARADEGSGLRFFKKGRQAQEGLGSIVWLDSQLVSQFTGSRVHFADRPSHVATQTCLAESLGLFALRSPIKEADENDRDGRANGGCSNDFAEVHALPNPTCGNGDQVEEHPRPLSRRL